MDERLNLPSRTERGRDAVQLHRGRRRSATGTQLKLDPAGLAASADLKWARSDWPPTHHGFRTRSASTWKSASHGLASSAEEQQQDGAGFWQDGTSRYSIGNREREACPELTVRRPHHLFTKGSGTPGTWKGRPVTQVSSGTTC